MAYPNDRCHFPFRYGSDFRRSNAFGPFDIYHFLMIGIPKNILQKIGLYVSAILLFVFYFLVFSLFAIPIRLASDFLKKRQRKSSFIIKQTSPESLKDVRYEG